MILAPLLAAFSVQGVPETPPEPIPVLLLTGANNHDWEWTSASLERTLEATGRFDVTVTTDPAGALGSRATVAPFRVFVLDYNGPRWGEPAESVFLEAVRGGVGVVVVHAANNAFDGWIGYEELVGLCWREGAGHGRFHPFDVRVVDRDHPITRTLPDLRAHPDELYHRLKRMHGAEPRVLAVARSSTETGGTGRDEPMVLVSDFGLGRVFHTTLGHVWRGDAESRASHLDPQFAALIARGAEWAATGDVRDGLPAPNRLEEWDRRAGWTALFDGETTAGWRALDDGGPPDDRWNVVNGALRLSRGDGGQDLATTATFAEFELELEWKAGSGADGDLLRPFGRWNHSRFVARGDGVEHRLNGRHVAEDADGALAPLGTIQPGGPLVLRDDGGEAWFRSIRVRDRAHLPGRDVELFDGATLAGWSELGDAVWSVEDGAIVGVVGGGGQSFLATEETYGDFFLELEVKNDGPGNSGIQVRSQIAGNGLLHGYQIEIDPSERAWSGGLYEEGRRAWLQDLSAHPAGRAAFRDGEWNRYRIECVGPSVRAWVNGVPTADWVEPRPNDRTARGRIGLQVHSGRDTAVRFRNLGLRVL